MCKKTILYGVGVKGEKCYCLHNSQYHFEYCIDRRSNREFHGLKVYSFEEKVDDLCNYFVIVAVIERVYKELKKNLEAAGLIEFQDFIWDEFLTEKKLAILYGNCHMEILTEYLRKNRYFIEEYFPVFSYIRDRKLSEEILSRCSLFICQDIREDNSIGCPSSEYYIEKVNKGGGAKY